MDEKLVAPVALRQRVQSLKRQPLGGREWNLRPNIECGRHFHVIRLFFRRLSGQPHACVISPEHIMNTTLLIWQSPWDELRFFMAL